MSSQATSEPECQPVATSKRSLAFYLISNCASELAVQIAGIAVAWKVYALTNSAFALGIVGLAQFLPHALGTLVAGYAADRYDRRSIVMASQIVIGLVAAMLAWKSVTGELTLYELLFAVALTAAAETFRAAATSTLLTSVAPKAAMPRASAFVSGGFQLAAITGPLIGGSLYIASVSAPYLVMATLEVVAVLATQGLKLSKGAPKQGKWTLGSFLAGVHFVRSNPNILGTISLDLFAVLLGGATTLLPIFAKDVLHTGPAGLGLLRAAPGLGGVAMAAILAKWPIKRRAGLRMLQSVLAFGLATVAFAMARSIWLTCAALALLGVADMVSMVIRIALVQLATPDSMRGRVGAVNMLFVGASYQLGGFESGVAASLFGAIPAALLGGAATVGVALLWFRLFPGLKEIDRLDEAIAEPPQ